MGCCQSKRNEIELSEQPKYHPVVNHFNFSRNLVKNSEIYEMECKHAYEYGENCKNILMPELLRKYYEAVSRFYVQLKMVNGPLGKREIYERFLLDGRFWDVHTAHYSICKNDLETAKLAFKGRSLCTAINSHVYAWNIFGSDTSLNSTSETIERFKKKSLQSEIQVQKERELYRQHQQQLQQRQYKIDEEKNVVITETMPSVPMNNFANGRDYYCNDDNDSDTSNDDNSNVNEPLLLSE